MFFSSKAQPTFGANGTRWVGNEIILQNGARLTITPCRAEEVGPSLAFIMLVNSQENGLPGLKYWVDAYLTEALETAEADFKQPRKVYNLVKDPLGGTIALISCMPFTGTTFAGVNVKGTDQNPLERFLPAGSGITSDPKTTGVVEVLDFYVAKHFWKQGIGKALWEKTIEELQEKGYKTLILSTNESHPRAHEAYRRLGCEEAGLYTSTNGDRNQVFIKHLSGPSS